MAAVLDGATDYWVGALARGATPLTVSQDVWAWWSTATERGRPSWNLANEVVLDLPVARLRDFSQGARDDVVATLVLPPQAGHDSCIVDYSPRQSQIQVIRDAGLTRVWSLDWKGATQDTRDATIHDYLDAIDAAADVVGGRVNLVGDCQGGWLATLWAALHPEQVHSLTIAGAPIDFHAGDPLIHRWVQSCAPGGSLAAYEALVASGGGVLKGEHMLKGFIALRPQSEIGRQVQLLANIHDEAHVSRYREFEDWFKHTQDIPGAFYLWIVEQLFVHNRLISGEVEVGGEHVDLRRIECPLLLLAGAQDHITPPPQVFALADHAATHKRQIVRRMAPGGHLGLFMGRESLTQHWKPLMRHVAQLPRNGRRRPVKAS